jgi:hypothetical protein
MPLSVDQPNVIDVLSFDPVAQETVLTISDHLDWSDTVRHQEILQRKLNAYLAFVERGEILEKYPGEILEKYHVSGPFQSSTDRTRVST